MRTGQRIQVNKSAPGGVECILEVARRIQETRCTCNSAGSMDVMPRAHEIPHRRKKWDRYLSLSLLTNGKLEFGALGRPQVVNAKRDSASATPLALKAAVHQKGSLGSFADALFELMHPIEPVARRPRSAPLEFVWPYGPASSWPSAERLQSDDFPMSGAAHRRARSKPWSIPSNGIVTSAKNSGFWRCPATFPNSPAH